MKIVLRTLLFILIGWLIASCSFEEKEAPLFELVDPNHSQVFFNNEIVETDSFNMYTFMNIYTGGGVAVGDLDNDGLEDIFFAGNKVPSKLYWNKGGLQFEEVTKSSEIETDRWCAGVSMVDINQDDLLDIYISVTGIERTENLLYINKGNLQFEEQAATYGLADPAQIMHSSFFDYDNDGDLDVYMIVNPVNYSLENVNHIKEKVTDGTDKSVDKLYRNDGLVFKDVSKEAGILLPGYSLGVSTCDINQDGWQDIYVSNDFLTNDLLYINQKDGTFKNEASNYLDHTSFAGMGNDIADINNDELPDIMVADMLPEDNARRQLIIPSSSYDKFQLTQQMNYEPQYTRNTLQLNNGDGTFSEIGQLAGIDKTDWSWSTLFADYDNDGDKDLLVTNGFLRDVGNLDYISYQRKANANPFGNKATQNQQRLKAIEDLGAAKIPNYIFENLGNLTFKQQNESWGLGQPSCSNGAAFADLDNDGDMELIINNVNDVAFIYENKSNELYDNNFIKIKLIGKKANRLAIGAKVYITTPSRNQYQQLHLYRGYESTVSNILHFGLGEDTTITELKIIWPDNTVQSLQNLSLNTQNAQNAHHTIEYAPDYDSIKKNEAVDSLFTPVNVKLDFVHQENNYVDFKIQPLLPHKHSFNGPGIAVGDIDGNGTQDCYIGGAAGQSGVLYFQTENGFEKSSQNFVSVYDDMGALFFDADNDEDLDLYIVSGGSEFKLDNKNYEDRLYENNGNGTFSEVAISLPVCSGGVVTAFDYDKDGDLDLFVGGRITPHQYPTAPQSYLLRNDSKAGEIVFADISSTLPNSGKLGMVTAALWTDADQDGWRDLMYTGEWMQVAYLKNEDGALSKTPINLGAGTGWWNSLNGADFDGDGDIDYVVGNLGLNSRHKASKEKSLCVYANDYDKNGRIDPVFCQYIGDERYIAHPRDLLIQQINAMRVRFKTYEKYGNTPFQKSFTKAELQDALVLKAENFQSSYIENLGNGKFQTTALPVLAQVAPVFGTTINDYDGDGFLDVLLVGNSHATEVAIGKYDALKGLLLKGNGAGDFKPQKIAYLLKGDAKALVETMAADGSPLLMVTNNSGAVQTFTYRKKAVLQVEDNTSVFITLRGENDKLYKIERYLGQGYLSSVSYY